MEILKTIDLKKYYGTGENQVKALDGVNLSVEEGEFLAVVGTSGSGKSTLLHMLGGLDYATFGSVLVSGKEIFKLNESELTIFRRRNIGFIFQNYNLVPILNVYENIVLPIQLDGEKPDKGFIREIMEILGIFDKKNSMPNQLSGGQQQRVALARIMAYEPEVILLDEPFSALDGYLKDRLQLELEEMLEDYQGTVIMVSHSRDEVYRFCEELVILEQGAVVVSGNTKQLFANPQYKEAAKLTGCKNITAIRRLDAHTAELVDWGIVLQLKREIPEMYTAIGYRAYDFIPIWGEPSENCLKVRMRTQAELPFEVQYYLQPENTQCETTVLSWFLHRDQQSLIEEKGMPDYLQIVEEKCMFLL